MSREARGTAEPWFPRPCSIEEIEPVGGEPGAAARLWGWLRDPAARELRELVGVAGPVDGAARSTTRLLEVAGTILKTSLAHVHATRGEATAAARAARARQAEARLWHPDKIWFVLPWRDGYVLATATPRLRTLRALRSAEERLAAFARALRWAWVAGRRYGVGLDLNPANFAIDPERQDAIVYLDDDLYPPLTGRELGEAMAARVPEERGVEPERWEAWGRDLVLVLGRDGLDRDGLEALRIGIDGYPVVDACALAKRALVAGARPPRRAAPRGLGDVVCVFADVHGNIAALEAVLAAAGEAGARSYLFLGDAVGYGPEPAACVERLAALERLDAVRGNHDHVLALGAIDPTMNRDARIALEWSAARAASHTRQWLACLPLEQRGEDWLAVHGAPRDPERLHAYVYELTFRENLDVLADEGVRVCFYGHTHVPFVHARTADGAHHRVGPRTTDLSTPGASFLVNPGSVGQPRDGDVRASFALWDRRARRVEIHRVAYDVEQVVRALGRAGLPADLGARLETGR